jgi:hypothetical protein
MGIKDKLTHIGDGIRDGIEDVSHGADQEPGSGLPAVPTPDQTRYDGARPGAAGELSQPQTSGDLE